MEWGRSLSSIFGLSCLILPTGFMDVPYSPCGYTGGGFPGPMNAVSKICCAFGAFFIASMERLAWHFSRSWLCLIKGIFLTKQRLSNPKLFLYMWNEFPFHAASVHGLGPLALESSSIVKSAVYTLYMVLFRLLSSLGWGSLWLGVCAASSTMGLIRDLLCSILMKANGLMKLRGQLKPSLYHTLVGSLSSREICAFQ